MNKKYSPIGVFEVPLFNTQVAVFNNLNKLQKYHTKVIGEEPIGGLDEASYGMCIMAGGRNGVKWFYIFISPDAHKYTMIHECSHLVDYVMDSCGVPIDVHNTEVRAYLLAAACEGLDEVLEGVDK